MKLELVEKNGCWMIRRRHSNWLKNLSFFMGGNYYRVHSLLLVGQPLWSSSNHVSKFHSGVVFENRGTAESALNDLIEFYENNKPGNVTVHQSVDVPEN